MKLSYPLLQISLLLAFITLGSCEKDRLTGANQTFEGEWEFVFCQYINAANTGIFPLGQDSLGFSAALRFSNTGMLAFIEDGKVIEEKKFKITNEQNNNSNASIRIKVKVDDNKLDINDRLRLNIINDTLIVDDFPFNGLRNLNDFEDGATSAGNYFIRK